MNFLLPWFLSSQRRDLYHSWTEVYVTVFLSPLEWKQTAMVRWVNGYYLLTGFIAVLVLCSLEELFTDDPGRWMERWRGGVQRWKDRDGLLILRTHMHSNIVSLNRKLLSVPVNLKAMKYTRLEKKSKQELIYNTCSFWNTTLLLFFYSNALQCGYEPYIFTYIFKFTFMLFQSFLKLSFFCFERKRRYSEKDRR